MKPAPFDYHAPRSVGEAVELLAAHGDDAKILAGGQSLVPAMNFRLARPAVLVDINRIAELDFCATNDGVLRIGALARHARFERAVTEGPLGMLLADVVRYIAHLPIRVRGTFAGSLAHADPAAEWCVVAATLDAEIRARGKDGERTIDAAAFFRSISHDLAAARRADHRGAPAGASGRTGASALPSSAGARATSRWAWRWRCCAWTARASPRRGSGSAAPATGRCGSSEAERALEGTMPGPEALAEAGAIAAARVEPFEDLHATAAYRRDLVRVMTKRALERALAP